jgi:hypothetical protein
LPVTGLAMMGAGLIVDLIGLVLVARATPHLWDAVNAYNDGAGAAAAGGP